MPWCQGKHRQTDNPILQAPVQTILQSHTPILCSGQPAVENTCILALWLSYGMVQYCELKLETWEKGGKVDDEVTSSKVLSSARAQAQMYSTFKVYPFSFKN